MNLRLFGVRSVAELRRAEEAAGIEPAKDSRR